MRLHPVADSLENRCPNEALVRVLRRYGVGDNPEHSDRCLAHAANALGPAIVAYRHPDGKAWMATGF